MPPARQPHGDLDRRQSDQYLGTHGARHWVYNVYNVPCLTKFSIIFCSKYAANILKWIKIYQNDKTKTSFPFEKGPSLKKKNMSFKQNGWKTATSATKPFLCSWTPTARTKMDRNKVGTPRHVQPHRMAAKMGRSTGWTQLLIPGQSNDSKLLMLQ